MNACPDYRRGYRACDASPEVQALRVRLDNDGAAALAAKIAARKHPTAENVAAHAVAEAALDATRVELMKVSGQVFDAAMGF